MFAGEEFGERLHVTGDEVEEFHQDAGPALRICSGPGGLSPNRAFNSGAHFRLRSEWHTRDHLPGHGLETIAEAPGCAADMLAADEMGEFLHRVSLLVSLEIAAL